ncbi:MAG: SapC family protein [Pseudomonadota bacterium]
MAEAQQSPVTGNVMFYQKPVPLNRETHKNTGVMAVDKPFEFMSTTHFVPLTAGEFVPAAASFPIIFAGDERAPLAVMGIRQQENLFVENGVFNNDFYLPAFARRYPFVLAGDQTEEGRFVVCVDEAATCITDKNPTQMLFNGEQLSDFTQEAFTFLQNFEQDRRSTQAVIDELKSLDLFEPKDMHFQGQNADGTPAERQKIADYFAVSEEKLRALPAETLKSMTERGLITFINAHLISLSNWQRLVNMTLRRAATEQKAA